MQLGFDQRTVLITGASGSIGRRIAEAFAAEGARVILHGHARFDDLEQWASTKPWRDRTRLVRVDLAVDGALEAALAKVLAEDERLDVVVANAGHWPTEDRLLHEIEPTQFRATIDRNLMSSVATARVLMGRMARLGADPSGQGPALVFVGSTAGRFGERGHADYATAKSALIGLALTLKNEVVRLDPWARVNVVEPGWTRGHFPRPEVEVPGAAARIARTMALRQLARGEDIARTILYLASPVLARHVTGQVVTVAGGMEGRTIWTETEIDESLLHSRFAAD